MLILILYLAIVVVGEFLVVVLGLTLDRTYPPVSLPVSLSLFFAVLYFAWPFSVRLTEPRHVKSRKPQLPMS
jgi:hypothetical protein